MKPQRIRRIIVYVLTFGRERIEKLLYGRGIARRFPLTETLYCYLYRYLLSRGFFGQPGMVALIKKLLGEGMTFVDVGANVGTFPFLAAKLVGAKGRVFAFEPHPDNFSTLKKITKGCNNVTAIQKAVSNKTGTTRLFVSSNDSTSHRIYQAQDGRNHIDVEVISLDDFFQNKDSRIDLLLMDAEGAEPSILEGMANLIKVNSNLRIITEFHPQCLEIAGCSPSRFLDTILDYGFNLYLADEYQERLKPVNTVNEIVAFLQKEKRNYVNLLCEKLTQLKTGNE